MHQIDDDMSQFLEILPVAVRRELMLNYDTGALIEVVLDLDRIPEARFLDKTSEIGDDAITQSELDSITRELSFGDDDRAGLEGTLHRISCIRNRGGRIVGLTCRVGRAIYGTAKVIEDILLSGKSILVLGKPGAGKSTILRDASRLVSTDIGKRVIIVDTSNEIAGDGDTPHRAVGKSRRMQVSTPARQAATMITAVENHMPEVIVIDEISNAGDVGAARTIAERGVQLIASAHGLTIESIISNPLLADLLGGVQTVVLSDEEAKKRGTAKSVLERKHLSTFDVVIELRDIDTVAVHTDVKSAVDKYLAGLTPLPQIRKISQGPIPVELPDETTANSDEPQLATICLFGISQDKVESVLDSWGYDAEFVSSPAKANLILTAPKQAKQASAYAKKITVVTIKSNTKLQIAQALEKIFLSED